MGPPSPERVFLRNYLTDTPKKSTPKSTAFSPDIIPSFGNNVPESSLISTYSNFVSLPVIPFDVNNVYVRGRVLDRSGSAVFNMVAVPSELILWPQVWNKSQPLAPGPIVVPTAAEIEYVGAAAPFTFRPSDLGGVNYALVAVQSPAPAKLEDNVRFKDALAPFPSDISNWRDYHDWVSTDKSTTFYNTIVADPTSPIISITTRLRLFEDEPSIKSIDVMLLFEHVGLDPNTKVSIVSDTEGIYLGTTKLGPDTGVVGVHTTLPSNFDGFITFNIFPAAEPPSDMSWVALQISTLKEHGETVNEILLGAQNVVFASDATRNARFLSPAALRASEIKPTAGLEGPTPAVGWWFRDNIGDQNLYPRTGIMSHSPDIQPLGVTPDSNAVADLSGANANVDITDQRGIKVIGGAPNFVYLRGNCTLGQFDVETRLFFLPSRLLLHPSEYAQYSVVDYDSHGDPISPAIRSIVTANAGDFNVIDHPFNILNPPVSVETLGLISETRHPTPFSPDPQWPHERTSDFATGADFTAWVAGSPDVAWRNVGYAPDSGADTIIVQTTLTILPGFDPTTTWILNVYGHNTPIGSSWQLTSTGDPIPGIDISFPKTEIISNNPIQGIHFTGLWSKAYQLPLTLQWWSNGLPVVGGDIQFRFALFKFPPNALAPSHRLGAPLPDASSKWPLQVGIHHPGLKEHANKKGFHALVPQFDKHGVQPVATQDSRAASGVGNGISLGGHTFVVRKK